MPDILKFIALMVVGMIVLFALMPFMDSLPIILIVGIPAIPVVAAFMLLFKTPKPNYFGLRSLGVTQFAKDQPLTEDQQKWLIYSTPGMFAGNEPALLRVFESIHDEPVARDAKYGLKLNWQVENNEDAHEKLQLLTDAGNISSNANNFFAHFITTNEKWGAENFGMELQKFSINRDSTCEYINKVRPSHERGAKITLRNARDTAEWITNCAKAYGQVYATLKHVGNIMDGAGDTDSANIKYTTEELNSINNFAALDLAQVATIARMCVSAGHMREEEVWPYIKKAAKEASAVYGSWREYLAAYLLGKTLVYGDATPRGRGTVAKEAADVAGFLLGNERSPIDGVEFKLKH